eukprot:Phypoly_transcript_00538.p1 GENE.Phypoly_transcript_00538~~Phypoly_transcript_00538.p1  ORF type:complete len:869 (-),score=236.22 Phypoly_transcript_00538:304-2910(-)
MALVETAAVPVAPPVEPVHAPAIARAIEPTASLSPIAPPVEPSIESPSIPSSPFHPPSPSPSSSAPSPSSPLASPMLSPSGPPFFTQADPASVPLHAAALRCVRAWVEWGVPVPDLLTDGGTLLGATFDGLASSELLSFAADVLVELFTPPRQLTSGLVVSSSRLCFDQALFQEVVRASISRVLSCIPLYKQAVIDRRPEVCVALSRVASAIGCGNPSTVLSTAEGLELLQFILTCSSHTDKTVVMPTLEFWETTASLVSSNPITQLNQLNQVDRVATITSSLSALLPILIMQCRFARDVSPDVNLPESRRYIETAESRSQEHDVLDFRLAAIDPLLAIFRALSAPRYLQLLAETLQPPAQQPLSWQTLEAVVYATKVVTEEHSTDLATGNALMLAVRLVEGVADVLTPGVAQQAIPALLASSFAGLLKTLPLEVWQHGPLTSKSVAILVALLSFPPRTSALFLENVANALVELTTQSLLSLTAPIFAPHLATIAAACVSNFLPSSVRDLLATTFLAIARISLPADQAGRVLSDMVSSLASRIVQHTNTTHAVSLEATLEVVADILIIDSLVGSKIPITEQLINNLAQLLETITQRTYAKEGASVIDAVCRVCTTLLSLPSYPASHTPAINILVATYVKTGQAAPLKALAYAISPNKGKNSAPPNITLAGGALEQVLAQVAAFSVTNIAALSIETLGSFFWTMTCAVQVSPPLPSLAPALLPVAHAAIASLPRMLEDPLAATYAIGYLALVPAHPLFAEHLPALRDPLVDLVFHVLPLIQERGLVRPLGDVLYALITHGQQGAATRGAVHTALHRTPAFARFKEEERMRVVSVIFSIHAKPRFRAMFTDLYGLAAGESDLDVLLAYEM